MKLFGRWQLVRVLPEAPDPTRFQELLALRLKLLELSRVLLALIKDALWVIEELRTEKLLTQLDDVADRFGPELNVRQAERLKVGLFEVVGKYLPKQKAYLNRKEAELKETIQLLSEGLRTLLGENEDYHLRLLQLGDRLVDITRLDDIRQLKMALQGEVTHLKHLVFEKRDREADRLVRYTAQIRHLESKLAQALQEAQKDALIGCYNRAAWQRQLNTCLDYAALQRHPFVLTFLRVDEFAAILHHFGSQIGNRVLVALYKACQQVSRPTDFIARYAEETFSIIFPADTVRSVRTRLHALVREIAASQYQFTLAEQTYTLRFTLSAGLCRYRAGDTRDSITTRGLAALQLAEDLGKNRLCTEKELKKNPAVWPPRA